MKYSVLSSVLPELTAEEVAKAIARAGYDGVEWRVNGEYHFPEATIEKEAPRIKALCDAHGIEIAGLTTYIQADDSDAIERLASAAQVMECRRFRLFSAHYDPNIGFWALQKQTIEKLKRAERILEGTGVKGLIEVHFGTIACNPLLAYELVRHCDPKIIGVIWDPANMVIEGSMDLNMSLDILGAYVDHVHVKNTRWERTTDGSWRWRFDELTEGTLDWRQAIRALKTTGYEGYLSFENLYQVPVQHRGHVGEDLTVGSDSVRDIDSRLKHELDYVRGLVEED